MLEPEPHPPLEAQEAAALLCEQMGRQGEALTWWQLAVAGSPQVGRYRLQLGLAQEAAGASREARRALLGAVRVEHGQVPSLGLSLELGLSLCPLSLCVS